MRIEARPGDLLYRDAQRREDVRLWLPVEGEALIVGLPLQRYGPNANAELRGARLTCFSFGTLQAPC